VPEDNLVQLKKLSEQIELCRNVKETLETDGWSQIIEPLIDRAILDTLGGKSEGRWAEGSLWDKRLGDAKATNLCWYTRALTDLHHRIYDYIDSLPKLEEEYKGLLKQEREPEYTEPMEDTSYAAQE